MMPAVEVCVAWAAFCVVGRAHKLLRSHCSGMMDVKAHLDDCTTLTVMGASKDLAERAVIIGIHLEIDQHQVNRKRGTRL